MQYKFILVEPAVAENVGASARALKTMGFDKLVVVRSHVHKLPQARWLAHGSADVMESIEEFDTLEKAVQDMDLVIGTTAKKRRIHADHYLCSEIPGLLEGKAAMLENVAIVFGREESGLTNEELKLCHVFSGIPMHTKYPSLNLSQSVMIYAWELSKNGITSLKPVSLKRVSGRSDPVSPAIAPQFKDTPKFRHFRKITGDLLIRAGYDKESPVYSRIVERLEAIGDKDARLLMSVCSKLEELISDTS